MTGMEDITTVKTLSMFHDPAWKPWAITNKVGPVVKGVLEALGMGGYYEQSGEAHERESVSMAKAIMGLREVPEGVRRAVHSADVFAASADRFLTPRTKNVVGVPGYKVNILNPYLCYEIKEPPKGGVEEFVRGSISLYSKVKDEKLRYNVVYTSLELMWYKYNPKSLPVADTRVLTHSVFDHLYAVASLSNWFLDGTGPSGKFVKVDIPGIQSVISKARKAKDLWAGSWVVSFLAYKVTEPLIREYGADVVISPFMGLNPFLISSLIKGLQEGVREGKVDKEVVEQYKALFPEDLLTPYQPVMPATVYLALPNKVGDVKQLISKNYLEAWGELVDNIDTPQLKAIRDYPVMPLRVRVLDVNEVYKEFTGKIKGHGDPELIEVAKSLFLDYMFRKVGEPDKVKVFFGVTYYAEANSSTTSTFREKRGYSMCTMCGVLPAVVSGGKKGEGDTTYPGLDEGENLCGYCYTKRAIGDRGSVRELLEALGFYTEKDFELLPSTIDIANMELWKEVLDKAKQYGAEKKGVLPAPLKGHEDVGGLFNITRDERPLMKLLDPEKREEVVDKLKEYIKDERFLSNLHKKVKTYYAIVRGDGDMVGSKVLKGKIKVDLKEYLSRARNAAAEEGPAKNEDRAKNGDRVSKMLDLLKELGLSDGDENVVPVTPVYLIAVSRALAVTAIKDAESVRDKGVLVFAGGDDVMFLTSVEKAMELVKETRSNYWGFPVGFHVINGAVFDSLALYGRSYGVLVAHYRDAVFNLWEIARELEELKDRVALEGEKVKDVTSVLKTRGQYGVKDVAVLYNKPRIDGYTLTLETFEVYEALKANVGVKGGLSSGFIKDWLGTDREVLREFPREAIAYLFSRNSQKWKGTKLEDLYRKLVGLDVVIKVEGGVHDEQSDEGAEEGDLRDERTELIKAYDHLGV